MNKQAEVEQAYWNGFAIKCAEAGVDAEALVKEGARGDMIIKLVAALKKARRVNPDVKNWMWESRNFVGDNMHKMLPTRLRMHPQTKRLVNYNYDAGTFADTLLKQLPEAIGAKGGNTQRRMAGAAREFFGPTFSRKAVEPGLVKDIMKRI